MKIITRTQILQEDSRKNLQQAINIYINNIQQAGAKIINEPRINIVKRSQYNIQHLKNKIRKYYIKQNNLKMPIKLSLNTSIQDLKKESMTKLAQKIQQKQSDITSHIYYAQICYKVPIWIYKSNQQDFS